MQCPKSSDKFNANLDYEFEIRPPGTRAFEKADFRLY
jgi:hypothetical protein